jgi:glycine/D-amino acid oxidase-like deaminating enzyme
MNSQKMPYTCDTLVVGGGTLGVMTALRLAERGVDVTVLECSSPMGEASGVNAGSLAAQNKMLSMMPHTLAALETGVLSEWRATIAVRESACLDVEDRRRLDAELCSDVTRLDGMGDAALAAAAKAIAYRLDPHSVVDRAARAQ